MSFEFVLRIICMHFGRALDFETRIAISSASRRFRKLCWTQTDQAVSTENHDNALLTAWSIAIYDFYDGSLTSVGKTRCCRKYKNVARKMFEFVEASRMSVGEPFANFFDEYYTDLSYGEYQLIKDHEKEKAKEQKRINEIITFQILQHDIETAKEFITKFTEVLDRKGYRFVIGYDKVSFVLYKTPVPTWNYEKYMDGRELDVVDERALKYLKN